jgi:hypothetical protein
VNLLTLADLRLISLLMKRAFSSADCNRLDIIPNGMIDRPA